MRRFFEGAPYVLNGDIELDVEHIDARRARLRLRRGRVCVSLNAAALTVPYPSGLRRLQAELPDVELVVVERAPAGLRAAAQQAGISWLDLDGAGRIDAGGLTYDAPPKRGVAPDGRANVSPFAPAASRVLKVLLSDPERAWRLSDVAHMAEINPGNAHRTLTALLRDGMLERAGRAYLVSDPSRMLDAWAARYVPPRERLTCAMIRCEIRAQPPIIEPGLPTLAAPGLAYALRRGPVSLQLTFMGEERIAALRRVLRYRIWPIKRFRHDADGASDGFDV